MDGDQIARLLYLGFLVVALGGWYVTQNRASLGKNLQFAAIWGFIFIGTVAVIGLWEDVQRSTSARQSAQGNGSIEVPRARDGHYYLTLTINNMPVNFVVDTGASQIVLTEDAARRVGLTPDELLYLGSAQTANGSVPIAQVTLDHVQLEDITDRNLRAAVNGGELFESLLGMDYLNRFSRIEIAGGRMILHR